MNAIEFVKDNKWLLEDNMIALREIVNESKDYKYFCLNNTLGYSYSNHGGDPALLIDDLKQIVDAFDLVDKYKNRHGGIRFRIRWGMFRYGDTQEFNDRLKQAINLVEQCQ